MRNPWLLLLLALLAGGCAPKEIHVGGKVEPVATKVVSLSPGTTELVAIFGYPGQLVGRTAACNFPLTIPMMQPPVEVYAGVKPDYEKLAKTKPSLVVYDRSLYSDADIAKLKELNLSTLEITANTVDAFIEEVKTLGDRLGNIAPVSDYVDRINSERSVAKANAPAKPPKVAVLTAGSGPSHLIAGTKSFVADVVLNSGGQPVGPDADRFVDANPETLIADDPDVIFLAVTVGQTDRSPAVQAVNAFMKDGRFAGMKAVKTNHVYPVSADVMLRKGSRVDKLIKNLATVIQAVGR